MHLSALQILELLGHKANIDDVVFQDSIALKSTEDDLPDEEDVLVDDPEILLDDSDIQDPFMLLIPKVSHNLASVYATSHDGAQIRKVALWMKNSDHAAIWLSYLKICHPSDTATFFYKDSDGKERPTTSIIIYLDALTRWSSTHTMLARAARWPKAFNMLTKMQEPLNDCAISDEGWEALSIVTRLLARYRDATYELSLGQTPNLSAIYVEYGTLLAEIRSTMTACDSQTHSTFVAALQSAHEKLAYYFHLSDRTPVYIWAVRKLFP